MTTPRHYFAYGSNMNPERFNKRVGPYASASKAALPGYKMAFNKVSKNKSGAGLANIITDHTSVVEGVLYELIETDQQDGSNPQSQIEKMDMIEGCPDHYTRQEVEAVTDDGNKVKAWVYVANPYMTKDGLSPESAYVRHMLKGREYLSAKYVKKLRSTKRNELAYAFQLLERDFERTRSESEDGIKWSLNVSNKLFETLKLLHRGNYPHPYFKKNDLIKLCRSLVADQCDVNQYIAGSWSVTSETDSMPSDARVDFIYLPTYLAIGILTQAQKLIPEIEKAVPRFWIAMRLGYHFASLRGLHGHGTYDDIGEGEIHKLGTIGILKIGGVFDFLAEHQGFSPELMRIIEKEDLRHLLQADWRATSYTFDSPLPGVLDSNAQEKIKPKYEVVLYNDDFTEMEFVIKIIEDIFYMDREEAERLTMKIDRDGLGACGIFSEKDSITLSNEVESIARKFGFPLKCSFREKLVKPDAE